ncbi:MAG: hypothetical protein HY719_14835 [Planctomycetes bacterium]|nr:hypothetical protein [Planctomycetota bacterium]
MDAAFSTALLLLLAAAALRWAVRPAPSSASPAGGYSPLGPLVAVGCWLAVSPFIAGAPAPDAPGGWPLTVEPLISFAKFAAWVLLAGGLIGVLYEAGKRLHPAWAWVSVLAPGPMVLAGYFLALTATDPEPGHERLLALMVWGAVTVASQFVQRRAVRSGRFRHRALLFLALAAGAALPGAVALWVAAGGPGADGIVGAFDDDTGSAFSSRATLWHSVWTRGAADLPRLLVGHGVGTLAADLPAIAGADYFLQGKFAPEPMDPGSLLVRAVAEIGLFGVATCYAALFALFAAVTRAVCRPAVEPGGGAGREAETPAARARREGENVLLLLAISALSAYAALAAIAPVEAVATSAFGGALLVAAASGLLRRSRPGAPPPADVQARAHASKNDRVVAWLAAGAVGLLCALFWAGHVWRVEWRGADLLDRAEAALMVDPASNTTANAARVKEIDAWLAENWLEGRFAAVLRDRRDRLSGPPPVLQEPGLSPENPPRWRALPDFGHTALYDGRLLEAARLRPGSLAALDALHARLLRLHQQGQAPAAGERRRPRISTASEDLAALARAGARAYAARPGRPLYALFALAPRVFAREMGLPHVRFENDEDAILARLRAARDPLPAAAGEFRDTLSLFAAAWGEDDLWRRIAEAGAGNVSAR